MVKVPEIEKVLIKGNEALAEGAVRGGCQAFFGYPITPQNEIPEYMSRRLPEVGGVFLQAESEVAAINMVYGAACAGARVMTTSSSPGVSLMTEGISYLAACELPCVIANIQRGGPGLGNVAPSQADYFQAVKGGGHGDYRMLVLAPWSVQETFDFSSSAFDLADKYRTPVMILTDGILGQMMEPLSLPPFDSQRIPKGPRKPWATTGCEGRPRNIFNSLLVEPEVEEVLNQRLLFKYQIWRRKEVRWEGLQLGHAEVVVVAYGTCARVASAAVERAGEEGLKVGLLRPITLFPFPEGPIKSLIPKVRAFLVVEMSSGQMVEDVRLAVNGERPVEFYGRMGGVVPTVDEVLSELERVWRAYNSARKVKSS